MAKSKFYELIKNSHIEKDIENVYTQGINLYFPEATIEHPFACDAFVSTKTRNNKLLNLVIEYKFDEDFKSKVTRAKVISQVLFYLKRFEQNGYILPNIVMVGDLNECFVFHSNDIISYLDEDIDWSTAPSCAYINNPELVMKIAEDENINPFIFDINEHFSFKEVVEKIYDLADNIQRYVHVTEHNIATIFEYFNKNVIVNKKKISANDLVAIFIGVITKNENYYVHPTKKGTLLSPFGEIKIDNRGFNSFFSYFNRNYTPQEKMRFSEISDRLIEDTNRRNKGEYYTPTLFVDYAHNMIAKQFGEDWKEKYVVWDNCAGTKNLTRDYYFKELYCSTLEKAELDISAHYNKEATSFQFDFLNDSLDNLPKGLLKAFEENKPIIFFINPPYARVGKGEDGSGRMGTEKGSTLTKINEQMKTDKIGGCSANLYAQFLYRIMMIKRKYNLTNCHIAMFTPTLYLSGGSWKDFRKEFFKDFAYVDGCTFRASHFADVADNWGISFSIWNSGETKDKNNFAYSLIDNVDGEIQVIGNKNVYNTDGLKRATEWVKSNQTYSIAKDRPCLTNGIKITENKKDRLAENALGSFINDSNNVDKNTMGVALFSTESKNGGSSMVSIMQDNLTKCTSLFAARRLVQKNWINWTDEYMKPNTEHENWQEFVNDSIVYSLFESKSNQSSLRQIEYKGKLWDIKNEFFWMSKNEMMALANENGNDHCYNDARVSSERYVYTLLQGITLSEEAKAVLDKACELVRKTFKYRMMFDEDNENYQINNWDASYYQLKALWKEYAKEDFDEFKVLYKKLGDKMRPMVYELGFLKQ